MLGQETSCGERWLPEIAACHRIPAIRGSHGHQGDSRGVDLDIPPTNCAGCFRELRVLGGSADRTNIGPAEIGVVHGLLLHGRLGGIWEAASGANRPEPLPTELNWSL